jgi:hypothetical protein
MDDTLRELRRRFEDSGDYADEVRWLQERVRAGEVSAERLRLAAHLGHDASVDVLGERPEYLSHDGLRSIKQAKCGIYRCERYHSYATGRLRHGSPLGWSAQMACPDAKPGQGFYLRSGGSTDPLCARALLEWLGAESGITARSSVEELLTAALGY